MKEAITMDRLDPARTALVVVHMVKGVAGAVDTPFKRIFRPQAEKTGIIGVQARLLEGFRTGKVKGNAKVVYAAVTYQPGYPGVTRNSRLLRTLIDNGPSLLLEGTPALDVHRAWFGETATADEVLSALRGERTDSGKSAEATRTAA
jgi:hypothetical protein